MFLRNPDSLLIEIADYVHDAVITSDLALKTAHTALLDSLGCAMLALKERHCIALLGPVVAGTTVPKGARVPGTQFVLDPIKAAFDIGTCIRWLDYNDTWLAAEWGHPSDNLGGLLAVADFSNRNNLLSKPILIQDLLIGMIKAYEIQGILALDNAFNACGWDHVILVKLATAAIVSQWLGLEKYQTMNALSQVWLDGASLRTYRQSPNTGPRKSWAAGDATARGVQLAWLTKLGTPGYATPLSAKEWGFSDVCFKGKPIVLSRSLSSYVMENILFKVSFPAEFHGQTAVECALALYPKARQIDTIEKIVIHTQAPAMRIIDKKESLQNSADRDHCLQYMVAIALLYGKLEAKHYSMETACDPRIKFLGGKMEVIEDPVFTKDYLDPEKRSIANAMQIYFSDGTQTEKITIEYPLGHQRRREEAMPLLKNKYEHAILSRFTGEAQQKTRSQLSEYWDMADLNMPVDKFIDAWIR
jgi:2-methylcitrate dehydratase